MKFSEERNIFILFYFIFYTFVRCFEDGEHQRVEMLGPPFTTQNAADTRTQEPAHQTLHHNLKCLRMGATTTPNKITLHYKHKQGRTTQQEKFKDAIANLKKQ